MAYRVVKRANRELSRFPLCRCRGVVVLLVGNEAGANRSAEDAGIGYSRVA